MSDPALLNALANLSPEKRALLADMLRPRPEPVAIIGMACRFPGGANSPQQFWRLLAAGGDAVTEAPPDRWPAGAAGEARFGAFIDNVDEFDPAFFGIAPREAARMDPQQRLFMEVAWEALENAGQTLDGLAGSQTGVYAAVYQGDYASLQLAEGGIDAHVASGMSHAIVANRLSHFLDVRGPSLAIDTACSSSLVALHLAVNSLREKETSLAVVGGVNLMLSPLTVQAVARWGAMAPDGRIKAFDAAADGFVRGEGCGVLVLKRLADAQRDGDTVLAMIRGTAVNQDGRTNVLTAPNGLAQKRVLEDALRSAGLHGEQVTYIEAHGTGTPLGDPIEIEALLDVYARQRNVPLWVGSVKTNLGHLEAAAGMAGLIKAVLALRHQQIPPHLHFRALNPHIALGEARIVIPVKAQAWPAGDGEPRRAGVSSFGFGGTNAHVILEEAPPQPAAPSAADEPDTVPCLLTFSAPQAAALPELARAYRAALDAWQAAGLALAGVCRSAALRRTHFNHRAAVAGRTFAEMAAALDAYLAGEAHPAVSTGRRSAGQAEGPVFVFSGQGVQWPGMGRGLYHRYPTFRAALDACDAAFRPHLGYSIVEAIFGQPGEGAAPPANLADTSVAQPAIFAVQAALAAQWEAWGVRPAAVVGHSLGEVAAAYVAGALSLDDAARVVAARSRLMQSITGLGKMAAISQPPEVLLPRLRRWAGLAVAAVNDAASTVVAGDPAELEALAAELAEAGVRAQYLPVNYAFHSPQVRPLAPALVRELAGLRPQNGRLPLASTVTGELVRGEALNAAYWGQNLTEPVLFARAVARLIDGGLAAFLEVSPHPALSQYLTHALERAERPAAVAHSLRRERDDALTLAANLGRLYAHGARPDWRVVLGQPGPDVALPNYPWQRRRYWFEAGGSAPPAPAPREPAPHPLLHRRVRSPLVKGALFESVFTAHNPPFQGDHRIHDVLVVPATTYLEMVTAAGRLLFGPGAHALREVVIRDALIVPAEGAVTVQLSVSEAEPGQAAEFQIFAAGDDAPDDWRLYARGRLEPAARAEPAAAAFDPAPVQARCADSLDGQAYYQFGREYGGALGPRFLSIQQLWRRPGEVVGRLAMAPVLAPEAHGHTVHPAYMDAAFHIAYAAQPGEPAGAGILMPVSFDEVCYYRPSGQGGWCHFTLRPAGEHSLVVGDVRVYDDGGILAAEAKGIRYLRAAGQDALLRHARSAGRDVAYRVAWQPARVDPAAPGVPTGTGWLILAGERGYGRALAAALSARGYPVAIAQPGRAFHAGPDGAFTFDPTGPGDYGRLLNSEWARQWPAGIQVVDLLWVDGLASRPNGAAEAAHGPDNAHAHLTRALFLAQAAAAYAGAAAPRLWLVTRRAQPAGAGEVLPPGALAWGFGRTLALEHPGLFGGLIDLGDQAPADAAGALAHSLQAGDGENQLALRGGERLAARLLRLPPPGAPAAIKAEATYLVTGALGGIGRHLARWLVEQGAHHLVLLSRSAASAEAEAFAASLRDSGAEVVLAAADVADSAALARVFGETLDRLPPLKGVFHAAGLVADAAIIQLAPARLAEVLAAKAAGAWNLHRLTAGLPLDYFVLFSSAAAVLGSPGQANYAAANAYLDALAHFRRQHGLPALSLNWGPWQAGMAEAVGDKGRQRWEAWGMTPLAPEDGLQHLARLLGSAEAQVAVLPMPWPPRAERALAHARRQPLFRELVRLAASGEGAGSGRAPASAAERQPPKLRAALAGLPARRRKQAVVDFLRAEVAAILGWEASYDIDPQQGFFDIGMDSLAAVELKERVDTALGLPHALPATVAFDYPTPDALAGYLLQQLEAAPAPEAAPVATTDNLDDLTEDELAALLADELRAIEEDK